MKHLTEYLWFNTKTRRDLVNITDTLDGLVKKSGVQDGFCLVSASRQEQLRVPDAADDGVACAGGVRQP